MKKYSIILPTINERKNLEILLPRIISFFSKEEYEIIIIDDDSKDETIDLIKELTTINIRLINGDKKGIGHALRKGYDEAKGNIIISMDADNSLDINEMSKMIKLLETCDVVTGSKYLNDSTIVNNNLKEEVQRIISKNGNKIIRLISGIKLSDFTLNFRCFKNNKIFYQDIKNDNNFFLVEHLLLCKEKGLIIREVPITFNKRIHGESKTKIWKQVPLFIQEIIRYYLRKKELV